MRSVRLYILLITLAIVISFVSSYFLLSQLHSKDNVKTDIKQITDFSHDFFNRYGAADRINFFQIYKDSDPLSMIDPVFTYPHTHIFDRKLLKALRLEIEDCQKPKAERSYPNKDTFRHIKFSKSEDMKLFIWTGVMECNEPSHNYTQEENDVTIVDEVITPKNFGDSYVFQKLPPHIHPSGQSFAWQYYKKMEDREAAKKWAQNNLEYFHILELEDLKNDDVSLGFRFGVLSGLTSDGLWAMLNQEEVILTKDYVFYRSDENSHSDNISTRRSLYDYLAFKRSTWNKALKDQHPYLKVKENVHDGTCQYEESNLCWYQDVEELYSFFEKYVYVFFAGSVIVVLIMVIVLFKKITEDKREQEKRRFALQTLTHELRTPLASLVLSLETLKKSFDDLNPEGQKAFGRILSTSARLQRLAEASRQYLTSAKFKGYLNLKESEIPSINEFVESIIEPYNGTIEFHRMEPDSSLRSDGYWLGICLKNLVNNAIEHGKAPVEVAVSRTSSEVIIMVKDQGESEFENLDQMKSAFVKNNKSQGLGLGLNLVNQILKEMGGRLDYKPSPTSFYLVLKEKK